jgi:hypothetical protein
MSGDVLTWAVVLIIRLFLKLDKLLCPCCPVGFNNLFCMIYLYWFVYPCCDFCVVPCHIDNTTFISISSILLMDITRLLNTGKVIFQTLSSLLLEIMKNLPTPLYYVYWWQNTTAKHFPKLVIVFATQWEGLSGHYTENGP